MGGRLSLSAYAAGFLFAVANGEEIAVAWHDTRDAAPGIYARRLRCMRDNDT